MFPNVSTFPILWITRQRFFRRRGQNLGTASTKPPPQTLISLHRPPSSKPDLARIQLLFSAECKIAVQDPVYPAYVDGSVMAGKTGPATADGRYEGITYLPCTPENDFFPELGPELKGPYVLFFCR